MESSFIALAFFSGYLGQAFEYWPFTLLITVTFTWSIFAIGSDIISRRKWKPPAGATPRMEFTPDPGVIARGRYRTGISLIRFGSIVTLVASGLFCYLANYPLAIGSNYGIPPEPDSATVAGTTISLMVAALVVLASIYIRSLPIPLILFILVGFSVTVLAPSIANGQSRWLGIMSAALSAPLLLILIGSTLSFRHYADSKRSIGSTVRTNLSLPIGDG